MTVRYLALITLLRKHLNSDLILEASCSWFVHVCLSLVRNFPCDIVPHGDMTASHHLYRFTLWRSCSTTSQSRSAAFRCGDTELTATATNPVQTSSYWQYPLENHKLIVAHKWCIKITFPTHTSLDLCCWEPDGSMCFAFSLRFLSAHQERLSELLPVTSNWSGHSPLTFHINRMCLSACFILFYLFVFSPFCVTTAMCENPRRSTDSKTLGLGLSGTNNDSTVKVTESQSHFLTSIWCIISQHQCLMRILTESKWLYALNCGSVIGCLDN